MGTPWRLRVTGELNVLSEVTVNRTVKEPPAGGASMKLGDTERRKSSPVPMVVICVNAVFGGEALSATLRVNCPTGTSPGTVTVAPHVPAAKLGFVPSATLGLLPA